MDRARGADAFFSKITPIYFLPQESMFISLHFDTKLISLPWKIMALEISMHKLFLTCVSASSQTFFEYLSMIFFSLLHFILFI